MFDSIRNALHKLRSANWRTTKLWEGDGGLRAWPWRTPGAIAGPEQALTLSPFFQALRLYQTLTGSMPLVTYKRDQDGGRSRDRKNPAYVLLHDQPNPSMSRQAWLSLMARDVWLLGDHFAQIRWKGEGKPKGIYPVPYHKVEKIVVDEDWNKTYVVRADQGVELVDGSEMLHFYYLSADGIRGQSILDYAAESLGLHRAVLDAATGFYQHGMRPSGYIKYAGKLTAEAKAELRLEYDDFTGATNTGKIPVFTNNAEYVPANFLTADDAKIIEAMGSSRGDIASWWNLEPLVLGDRQAATYSNLGAANTALYQRSMRPYWDMVELENNAKLFGPDADVYCEFLTESLLKGDPAEQAGVYQTYVQMGAMTRAEVREGLNLPPIDGLDKPLFPLNQGPEMANKPTTTTPEEHGPTEKPDPSVSA